ncbi:MAG: glycosyl hydrolase family 8 [Bacteroidales bacterium]|nr:glycosyl hydrolase family 8 [Bacteroidales bacterium]
MRHKIIVFFGFILLALTVGAQNEVTVHINSGNPNFPFPQFLDYSWGTSHKLENLGTQNPEGVVHAEMEQDIRDAYQIFANEWTYTGDVVNGVKYIRGNIGCPYDCREGDGYSLLAAALMGDKTSFDGLWMCVHDKARVKQPRYIDGVVLEPNYAYGDYALKDNANSATDGDVDIALALYVAWMQWGDDMGVKDSKGNMISYRKEMIDVIRGLVAMSTRFPTENPQRNNTGEVGFDGYMKNGDTWTEITGWASQAANYYVENGIQKYPEYGGPQQMHTDYLATGYFREFYDLLQKLDLDYSPAWEREQYRRAEASGDWMVGNWVGQSSTNIFLGEMASVSNANVVTMEAGNQGGRFRSPWRTALNYVWHGNPTYSWNPTTHKVVDGGNSYELNAAKQFSGYMSSPQDWGKGCACTKYGGGPDVTYKGPSTLQWDINPDGTSVKSAFTLNWVPACGTPSAVAAQDLELLGQLYRQCNIEWDVKTGGDGYLSSVPVYFHGFFRLLGMLIATGNHQAPSKMVPQANMKIYRVVEDSVSCAYTGDELTYHLDYRNYGSVDATDVKIVENVPKDFIFVSATNGGVYNAKNHTVTWEIGNVPGVKDASVDVTKGRVSYSVKIGPSASGRYCTTADITCSNGLGWTSNEYPNAITPTMQRNCVDVIKRSLIIEKTADREQANPGAVVNYTISFENSSEAGWLDGGRPRVGVAVSNAVKNGGSQMWLRFRLYNDAIEPYINYGNYRIAYYMYDASMKQLAANGRAGWNWYTAVYEGKRSENDKISVSHETVVEGSDEYGKWNQRLLLQFAPLLVTSTGHISNYYGMGARVHRGGAEPLRVFGYINPSDWSATNFEDDWSYSTKIYEDEDDGTYNPVTPSWQEIDPTTGKSIEKEVTTYNPSICEKPKATINNILVEEFDGYTWRRILGTGPMAGRDAENVVIVDTLPKGLTFVAFQGKCPLENSGASWRTYKIADGRDVVEWKIPMLQIKQKGSIVYSATANFPSGAKCQSADEDIENLAWIYADLNSPIADTATVTITCAKVPEPVVPTTLSKVASSETVGVGDNITFDLEYEQTHGYLTNNAGANASDWSGGSVSNGTVTNNSGTTTMYNNSTSENIYVEFDASLTEYAEATFIFRGDQKITVKKDYGVLVVTYGNKTERIAESSSDIHFAIDLSGTILRLWNSADTSASAPFTVENVPVKEGKFGFNSPAHGNHKYSNIHVHTDYAYNLKIVDDFPSELEFVSATDGGLLSNGNVVWTFEQGMDNPIPFGKKYTVSVTATVKECSERIINEAHVSLLGHADDEIRAQAVVECSNTKPEQPIVEDVKYCQGEESEVLTAEAEGELVWYDTDKKTKLSKAPTPSTADYGTTTYYVSQILNGEESDKAEISVVVNPKPSTPKITTNSPVCAGSDLTISTLSMKNASYAWTGPNGYTSDEVDNTIASATVDAAGDYSVVVTSEFGCASDEAVATVVVNPVPEKPEAKSPILYCKGAATTALSATGKNIQWYSTATAATALATTPVPSSSVVKDVTYYVTQTVDGCESEREEVIVSVVDKPAAPEITVNSPICEGETLELGTELDGTYEWNGPNGFHTIAQNPTIKNISSKYEGEYTLVVTVGDCVSDEAAVNVVVNSIPKTPVPTNNGPKCDGEEVTLSVSSVSSATYTWAGPDEFTSDLQNPKVSASGEYSLIVTVNNCSSESAATLVEINPIPDVPVVDDDNKLIQYCKGELVSEKLSATGENLKWYTTSTGTTTHKTLVPSTSTVGSVHYYVSQTVKNCESERIDIEVKTLEPPTKPVITTNSPVCAESELTLETDSEGTYSWSGPNKFSSSEQKLTIDAVSTVASGEYSLIVKVGNCTSEQGTATVVVNPVPVISIDAVANQCVDGENVTLKATATPAGGTGEWSGTGVSGSVFSPAVAGVGTHKITYTYEVNGCSKSEEISITVQDKPDVDFELPETACKSESIISLTGNKTGGTFTATPSMNLESGFNPNLATIKQEYSIVYEYSDGVCSNSVAKTIKVYDPEKPVGTDVSKVYTKVSAGTIPDLVATGVNQLWYSDEDLTVKVGEGNSYTPEASVVIDGVQGKPGKYTYYVVSTEGGCVSEKTAVSLDISECGAEAPVPVTNIVKVCKGETDNVKKTLTVTAEEGNVRWYYNDSKVHDEATKTYIPTQTEAGSYTFYVSLYDNDARCESGKSSITYIINALPSVSFDIPAEVCDKSETIQLAKYKSQENGVVMYEGNEITTISPDVTNSPYQLTYSYTDDNQCSNSVEKSLIVNNLPSISLEQIPEKCEYDDEFDLSDYVSPKGGQFSGLGVSREKMFNPAAVTAGSETTVTYSYTDEKSCFNSESLTIKVNAKPAISLSKIKSSCVDDEVFDLLQYAEPATGEFSGEHVTDNKFSPEQAGDFNVTYKVVEEGCENSVIQSVKVNKLPILSLISNSVECKNTGEVNPMVSPAGGTLYVNDNAVTGINTNDLLVDNYVLKYVYTDENNCTSEVTKSFEIREIASPKVNDKQIVVTSPDLVITAEGNGGTLVWEDESGTKTTGETVKHPSSENSGEWSYCVTETDGTCTSEPACMKLTIVDCPTPAPSVTFSDALPQKEVTASICASDNVPTFVVSSEEGATINWYKNGRLTSVSNPSSYTPTTLKGKAGTTTWTVTQTTVGEDACEGPAATVVLTVNPNPEISIDNETLHYCDYSDPVLIEVSTNIEGGVYTFSGEAVENGYFYPQNATTIGNYIPITVSYVTSDTHCSAEESSRFYVHHVDALDVVTPITQLESDYETVLEATPSDTKNKIKWYDACETKELLYQGTSFKTGLVGLQSEDYGVTQVDKYGCESECATIQVDRIKCPTPAPSVYIERDEICATDEIPMFVASGKENVEFTWYEDGVVVYKGESFEPSHVSGIAGFYNWSVTQTTKGKNGCEGVATPVSLRINPSPEIIVTIDEVICINEGVKVPQSNLEGTVFAFNGKRISEIDPTQYAPGEYELKYAYYDPKTGCTAVDPAVNCYEESCLRKKIEIREIPQVNVDNITNLVIAESFPITITSGNGGTYTWTDSENNVVGTGETIQHQFDVAVGSWTYCVTESDGVCSSDPSCLTYTLIDCPVPAPTIENRNIIGCTNEDMKSIVAENKDYTVRWYKASDMNTILWTGLTYTPDDITMAGVYKYYAAQYDGVCEGLPTLINYELKTTEQPEIEGNKVICENEELTLTAENKVAWYSADPSSSEPVAEDFMHVVSFDEANEYTLYVVYTDEYCSSNPLSISVQVNKVPDQPIVTTSNVCEGEDVEFTATGNDIIWYQGGFEIAEGNEYVVSETNAGEIIIQATQTVNGCMSEKTEEVTATIYSIPSRPTAVNTVICDYDDIEPVEVRAYAEVVKWYADEELTDLIEIGTVHTPKAKESKTFYVIQEENNCRSLPAEVSFTVQPQPSPVNFKQTSDIVSCVGNDVVIVAESSNSVYWYDDENGFPIFSGRYFTISNLEEGSYVFYAKQKDKYGCISEFAAKRVTLKPAPTEAIVIEEDSVCIYDEPGTLIVERTSSNENVSWIAPDGSILGIGDTLNVPAGLLSNPGIYLFRARTTVSSCSYETRKEKSVKYVILPQPSAPKLDKDFFCYDSSAVKLSAQGENILWYTPQYSLISGCPYNNNCTTYYVEPGTYEVLMTQMVDGCVSDTITNQFYISALPTPIITGKSELCANTNEVYVITKTDMENSIDWTLTGDRVSYAISDYNTGFVRSVDWTQPGVDTIFVIETNKYGCKGSTDYVVEVIPVPDAQFMTESLGQEGVVTFYNTSEKQILEEGDFEKEYHVDYYWDFGRSTDSTVVLENAKTFEQRYRYGEYTAEMTAVNEFGCSSKIDWSFFVDVEHRLYIPSAFAPLSTNAEVRVFKPKGVNCRTFEIWIYDAWNNLVYYSEGIDERGAPRAEWDGKVNGKMMQSGTYRYKVIVTYEDHEEENLKIVQKAKPIWGNVVLLR